MKRQKSKNGRDKSGCFVDSLDLTNSEKCNHLQLGPCCYCCYCSGSHSDGSQTCRGLVTVALSLPVLLMASRGAWDFGYFKYFRLCITLTLLSNFRKLKLLFYHLFGRLSVAHGFHIFPVPLFLQFLLYSSPPPQRKIFFSSKYFHLPVLLMDNEYDRISVEIVDTLDSGWGNMPLKYVFFCCFFALISFYLPINMFNLFCWWCNNHNISCSL